MVHDRLGQECDAEFALACHEATLGNPLRVTALASAWAMGGRAPVAAAAEEVRTMRTTRVRDRLVACMRGLSGPARALLVAMAVLVDAEEPRMAGELAELDEDVAAQARRSLRRLGLLTGDEFAHLGVRDAAEELMTPAERLITCTPGDTIARVMGIMTDRRVRHLPVLESGRLAGIISIGDIVKARLRETLAEVEAMTAYVRG